MNIRAKYHHPDGTVLDCSITEKSRIWNGERFLSVEELEVLETTQSLAYDPERYPHCIEIDARQ